MQATQADAVDVPIASEIHKGSRESEDNWSSEIEEIDSIVDISGKSLELSLFDGDGPVKASKSVEGLYVYRNVFNLIPKSLGSLGGRLKTLKFFANEVNLFPEELRDLIELETLQVRVCALGFNGLPLHKLKGLRELELSKAPLRPSSFPLLTEIAGLSCLTRLSVCHFSISYLPPEIGSLKKLEYLDLSFNKLKRLPEEMGFLIALKHLKVANNKLVELPLGLSLLQRLENLDLSRNRLTSLGALELSSMHKLQELNLQYNKLLSCCQIPVWICCKLDGNFEDESEELINSAVEMDVIESSSPDDEICPSNVTTNSSSSQVGSSSSMKCNAKRRLSKRWKRRQYLQQRARQERLNSSRKLKVDGNANVMTSKTDEGCRACGEAKSSKPPSKCDSGLICYTNKNKQSISENSTIETVVSSAEDDGIDSKGINLEDCSCSNISADSETNKKTEESDLPTCLVNLASGNKKRSSAVICTSIAKSKRHSDQFLGNPKPRKYPRSVDFQLDISRKYSAKSFCSVEEYLSDGFYDAGRDRPFMSLRNYKESLDLDSREVILVDRDQDEELDAITLSAQASVYRMKQLFGSRQHLDLIPDNNLLVASVLALFVSDHFGGSDRSSLVERARKNASGINYSKPFVCTCSTGNSESTMESSRESAETVEDILFREICEKSIRSIKARRDSVIVPIGSLQFGVCRHRALLMKYLCDRMDPPVPCELIRGYLDFFPHAWNAILVKKTGSWVRVIVDACRPHDIREETDPEYFCRYFPLTRVDAILTGDSNIASLSNFPTLSTCEEVEKVAKSSLILCKVGSAEAVAKVRTLELVEASIDVIKKFEYSCMGEVRILGAVKGHSCIIEMYGHQISSKWIQSSDGAPEHRVLQSAILMEYVQGGSLKRYIDQLSEAGEKRVPMELILTIARDLACGLKELHSKHIIHRDIKSENVLIDLGSKKDDGSPLVKICDFDRAVPLRSSLHSCCISHIGIHTPDVCVGTPRWMAPEVLHAMHERNPYGLEVDVWSYGCLLLELLTLQVPYFGLPDSDIHELLQNGERPPLSDELQVLVSMENPTEARNSKTLEGTTDAELEALSFLVDVYHKCTESNPADRPSASDLYPLLASKTSSFTSSCS
ncbi:hypothetical protein V2J09_018051 [Rumex salicifolius]